MNNSDMDFILKVLKVFADYELHTDNLWWRCDEEYAPVTFIVNCNDVFAWACSDAETITPDNIDLLVQTLEEASKTVQFGECHATDLWIARLRNLRPQNAMYKYYPKELWPLFDASGPERPVDFGNPASRHE